MLSLSFTNNILPQIHCQCIATLVYSMKTYMYGFFLGRANDICGVVVWNVLISIF